MIRFLAILALVYFLFKVFGSIFRVFLGTSGHPGRSANYQSNQRPRNNGEVNIDFVPNKDKSKHVSGGDYVEYEEVNK